MAVAEPLVEQAPIEAPWRVVKRRTLPLATTTASPARLRRCVYRRLSPMTRTGALSSYTADCLYEGLERAVPLGDLDATRSACEACANIGLWRADED